MPQMKETIRLCVAGSTDRVLLLAYGFGFGASGCGAREELSIVA
jgi:hypothetical protein